MWRVHQSLWIDEVCEGSFAFRFVMVKSAYDMSSPGVAVTHFDKQAFIRRIAIENQSDQHGLQVLWSRHATARLVDYDLHRVEVEAALARCIVIENYPIVHRPLPDCLVLAYLGTGDPMHAVIAIDEAMKRLFVVTLYRPSPERWQDDWRTRK